MTLPLHSFHCKVPQQVGADDPDMMHMHLQCLRVMLPIDAEK